MEDSKSSTINDDVDNFFDALDEFPFYDCVHTTEPNQSISQSSDLEPIESNADVSHKPQTSPDIPSPPLLRRRRTFSQHICKDTSGGDSTDSNPNSSVSFDTTAVTIPRGRKVRFSRNLKENDWESEKLDSFEARFSSGRSNNCENEEIKENSTVITANDERTDDSTVSFDINDPGTATTAITTPKERKYRFSRSLKQNDGESEKLDSFEARFSSGRINNSGNEEIKENPTVTTANDVIIDESSSNFLFFLAGFVIKAIGFQINLLVRFITFPIWLLYCSYMIVIDPFGAVRHGREYLTQKLLGIWAGIRESVTPYIYEWFKEHESIWKLALRIGWGLLWSVYVCFVLVSLLVSAFLISGFIMRLLVDEPTQMKETLDFDYTKNSPVAFVPIISCPAVLCGVNCREKIEVGKLGEPRVIPVNHKLRVTVSLALPESDYNRNLGIFQVRVDFLSVHGKALASSRHPCMLQFKSQTIRLLSTFLKVAPLMAGYFSESQTVNINFRGYTEGDIPTACLRVIIEQRAEFRPGAGIPEIYAASLTLESELPLLKRILWYWKKTIFIWISMTIFTMELLFTLLCCKPFIIPRVRLRGGSASSTAPQNNLPVQRS